MSNQQNSKTDDTSTIGSDLEDEDEWNSSLTVERERREIEDDEEEDLVSFLLSNVMPRPKRANNPGKKPVCNTIMKLLID